MIRCPGCKRTDLRVTQRLCNYSAFSGYRRTPSDYSQVKCRDCGRVWRTKADVGHIRDGSVLEPERETGGDRG